MALIAHFRQTFAFDAWANRRLLEVFADLPLQHEVLSTWSHLLLAQKLWLARINDEAYDRLTLWTVLSVPESADLVAELERRWSHLLEDLKDRDLEREVTFTNTQGRPQRDRLGSILTHVTHHAAHHRGQLTVRMSAAGFNPPTTDLISYIRSQHPDKSH